MTTLTAAPPSKAEKTSAGIDWFPVAVFALVWIELISRLRFEWSINPQYGYGWTVPFLAAYLFWRRSHDAPPSSPPRSSVLPVLAMILFAALLFPIRLIQEANPDWRLLSWGMVFCAAMITAAGIFMSGGLRWVRHFAFPILFFFVAVPWPTNVEQFVIQGLMRADALINVEFLNAIGIPAVQLGNVIEVGSGFVGIDEACTGIRSLQATFMVSLFLGEFYEFTLLRRIVLVVAGALFAFICNLVRTFILVYVGAEQGNAAIKNWHDPAGHTILMICLLGLWGLSFLLRGKGDPAPTKKVQAQYPFRVPRLALVCLLALTLFAEAGTQVWYRAQEARAARLEPWKVAWPTEATNWKPVAIEEAAQGLLRYNEGGGGTWTGEDGHNWTMYFFRWLPGRTAALFIKNHRPDICLPASGMTLRGDAQHKLLTVNGVTLPIRSYTFQNGAETLHVFYCYWDGTPPQPDTVNKESWSPAGRLENVRRGKRDVGTQTLEIVAWGYDSEEKAEQAAREQLSRIVQRG
jgi:exosortase